MIPFNDVLNYEIRASAWWASFICWEWGQDLAASYFYWKAKRKYASYLYWAKRNGDDRCV